MPMVRAKTLVDPPGSGAGGQRLGDDDPGPGGHRRRGGIDDQQDAHGGCET
jgi:hypothetical protein